MQKILCKVIDETVEIDGVQVKVDLKTHQAKINEKVYQIQDIIELSSELYRIHINNYVIDVQIQDSFQAFEEAEQVVGTVQSPMSGQVTKINVQVGQKIEKGELVLLLSAMKMENEIVSPTTGEVKKLFVNVNDRIGPGDLLFVIE